MEAMADEATSTTSNSALGVSTEPSSVPQQTSPNHDHAFDQQDVCLSSSSSSSFDPAPLVKALEQTINELEQLGKQEDENVSRNRQAHEQGRDDNSSSGDGSMSSNFDTLGVGATDEHDPDSGEMELYAMMDSLVAELQMEMDLLGGEAGIESNVHQQLELQRSSKTEMETPNGGETSSLPNPLPGAPDATQADSEEPQFERMTLYASKDDPDFVPVADYTAGSGENRDRNSPPRRSVASSTRIRQQSKRLVRYLANYLRGTVASEALNTSSGACKEEEEETGTAFREHMEYLRWDDGLPDDVDDPTPRQPPSPSDVSFEKMTMSISPAEQDYVPVRDYTPTKQNPIPFKGDRQKQAAEESATDAKTNTAVATTKRKRRGKREKDTSIQSLDDTVNSSSVQNSGVAEMHSTNDNLQQATDEGREKSTSNHIRRRTNKHLKKKKLERILLESVSKTEGSQAASYGEQPTATRDDMIRTLANSDLWQQIIRPAVGKS